MSIICAKYRRCLPSFARPGSMRSSGFAIQRICAAPIPVFSGRRLNLISETLWTICALPRKVSSGSPIFMLTCSQRNIAEPSELIEPFLLGDLAKAALPGQFSKLRAHFFCGVWKMLGPTNRAVDAREEDRGSVETFAIGNDAG